MTGSRALLPPMWSRPLPGREGLETTGRRRVTRLSLAAYPIYRFLPRRRERSTGFQLIASPASVTAIFKRRDQRALLESVSQVNPNKLPPVLHRAGEFTSLRAASICAASASVYLVDVAAMGTQTPLRCPGYPPMSARTCSNAVVSSAPGAVKGFV